MKINNQVTEKVITKAKGFALVEIILAVALWALIASSGVTMTVGSLQTNRLADESLGATLFATEGLDAVEAIKRRGWTAPFLATNCVSGCGLATVSGTWAFSGTSNASGKLTRQLFVTAVNRNVSGDIVDSGGTVDADTYKVESRVTWSRGVPVVSNTISLIRYLTNYAKTIITTLGGPIVYSDGTTTPKYRDFTVASGTFGTAQNMPVGASGRNFQIKTSPTKKEAIAAYVTSAGLLQVMCYNGTSWSNDWTVTVGGTSTTVRFDIAYENNSGDAMVLYSTNTATNNELGYRTKLGSVGCGAANWTAAVNYSTLRTTGIVQWVKMVHDDRASSNLITAAWADANSDLSAMQWSGTAWGNEPAAVTEANLERVAASQDIDSFALAYETLSGDVMLVWGTQTTANAVNGVRYRTCTGGTATCTWGTVTTPPTFADDATTLDLSSSPNSDEMIFASIGNQQSDLQIGYWNGTAWTNTANVDTSAATPVAGSKLVASGMLTSGGVNRGVVVYNDSAATNLGWYVMTNGSAALQTDFTPNPVFNATQRWYDIRVDPVSKDRLMFTISSSTASLFAKQLLMTSAPVFTWSNTEGGAALTTALPGLISSPFAFDYWQTQ